MIRGVWLELKTSGVRMLLLSTTMMLGTWLVFRCFHYMLTLLFL
jgi:hypothetical protein